MRRQPRADGGFKGALTEEANRPNRGPGSAVMGEGSHGWVRFSGGLGAYLAA